MPISSPSPIAPWKRHGSSAFSGSAMPADDALRELLGHIPFFAGLWDRGLEWVAATLVERTAAKGADVFLEGEPGCALFVVKRGELAAIAGGKELTRFAAGDFFGET